MPDEPTAPPEDAGRKLVRVLFPRDATAAEIVEGLRRLTEGTRPEPPSAEATKATKKPRKGK